MFGSGIYKIVLRVKVAILYLMICLEGVCSFAFLFDHSRIAVDSRSSIILSIYPHGILRQPCSFSQPPSFAVCNSFETALTTVQWNIGDCFSRLGHTLDQQICGFNWIGIKDVCLQRSRAPYQRYFQQLYLEITKKNAFKQSFPITNKDTDVWVYHLQQVVVRLLVLCLRYSLWNIQEGLSK